MPLNKETQSHIYMQLISDDRRKCTTSSVHYLLTYYPKLYLIRHKNIGNGHPTMKGIIF